MISDADLVNYLPPGLLPVPAKQPGVCVYCRAAINEPYNKCYNQPCHGEINIVPISMSLHSKALHYRLRHYKDGANTQIREKFAIELAVLVELFLRHHSECLGGYDTVASVPSTDRDAPSTILRNLKRFTGQPNPLVCINGKLQISDPVDGKRVLLFDDTLTTGTNLKKAYDALANAGATVVGPLVVGRHINPTGWAASKKLLKCLEDHQWTHTKCILCSDTITCDPPIRQPKQLKLDD